MTHESWVMTFESWVKVSVWRIFNTIIFIWFQSDYISLTERNFMNWKQFLLENYYCEQAEGFLNLSSFSKTGTKKELEGIKFRIFERVGVWKYSKLTVWYKIYTSYKIFNEDCKRRKAQKFPLTKQNPYSVKKYFFKNIIKLYTQINFVSFQIWSLDVYFRKNKKFWSDWNFHDSHFKIFL